MISISELKPRTGIEYLILNAVNSSYILQYSDPSAEQEYKRFIFCVNDYLDGIIGGDSLVPQIKHFAEISLNGENPRKMKQYLKNLELPDQEWESALLEATPKIIRLLNGDYV